MAGQDKPGHLAWGPAVRVAAVGLVAVNLVAVAVGFVAKALQHVVDDHFYDYIQRVGHTPWSDTVATLTKMGNVPQTQLLTILLAAALTLWFSRRQTRWWMPLIVLPGAWAVERVCQLVVAKIIGRDREPLSLLGTHIGAYPSGGVARIIVVTGVAVALIVHYLHISQRATRLLYVIPAVLGVAEAYFRGRLNQHWLTDIVAGLLFGAMMVWVAVRTVRTLDPDPPPGSHEVPMTMPSPAPTTLV